MIDNHLPVRIENVHAIVHEPGRQHLIEKAKSVIDAKCICGLPQSYSGHIESGPPFNQRRFDAARRKCCRCGQAADTASNNKDAFDLRHEEKFLDLSGRQQRRKNLAALPAIPGSRI
jgi:hypothetical protein